MKRLFALPAFSAAVFLAVIALTRVASAATWYVSPTGTGVPDGGVPNCSSRATPCDLPSAAAGAIAGDTVILMDGVYKTQLVVANSGTSSAWITFQADTCATPIIQGPGVGPTDTNQATGVGSSTSTYVRFVGIVSTGWSAGLRQRLDRHRHHDLQRQLRVRRLHRRLQRPHRHHVLQRDRGSRSRTASSRTTAAAPPSPGRAASRSTRRRGAPAPARSKATSRSRTWTARSTPTAAASSSTSTRTARPSSTTSPSATAAPACG